MAYIIIGKGVNIRLNPYVKNYSYKYCPEKPQ